MSKNYSTHFLQEVDLTSLPFRVDGLSDWLPVKRADKGEKINFIVETPDRPHLLQVIKVNITSDVVRASGIPMSHEQEDISPLW